MLELTRTCLQENFNTGVCTYLVWEHGAFHLGKSKRQKDLRNIYISISQHLVLLLQSVRLFASQKAAALVQLS